MTRPKPSGSCWIGRKRRGGPPPPGGTLALVGTETFTFRELLERMLEVLGLRRAVVPVPFPLAGALAAATGWLPVAPLTREEGRLLRTDKVAGGLPTPASLGVAARSLAQGLPGALRPDSDEGSTGFT